MTAKKSSNEAWAACDERVLGVLERIATALERLSLDAPLVPATRAHVEGLGLSALQASQVAAPPVSLTEKEPPCSTKTQPTSSPTPTLPPASVQPAATPEAVTTPSPAGSGAPGGTSPLTPPAASAQASTPTPSTAASPSDPDTKPSALAEQCKGSVVDLGEDTRDVPSTHDLWVRFPWESKAELQDLRDCGLARPGSEIPDSVTIKTVKRLVCRALCPNGDDAARLAAWKAHVAKLDASATPGTQVSGAPEVWKLAAIVWAVPVAQLDGSAVS